MSQAITQRAPRRSALDTTPGKLWLRQGLIIVLTLALGLVSLRSYSFLQHVAQTVGKDAVPSIITAEKIRTTLAYAHTELTNAFLTKEKADGPSMQAYRKSMSDAQDQILTAAQNITYGEEERAPILSLMNQVLIYEGKVGAAINAGVVDQHLLDADALMRSKILPAAEQLDAANFNHLDSAYQDFKQAARGQYALVLLAAIALGLVLLECQLFLYRQFRRIINLPIALATGVLAFGVVLFATHGAQEMESLRSAKEDAFDSVHALSRAKAVAYETNALESLYLLRNGDAAGQAVETQQFKDAAASIWHGGVAADGKLPPDLKTLKGTGMLGDELANLTFDGEGEAATRTLNGWINYVVIDNKIRTLEAEGQHSEAVRLDLGKDKDQSDWAFEQFDKALDDTLKINSDAFAAATTDAFTHVQWLLYCAIAMILGPLLGSLAGLQLRLAEFRE
jgi:hypothetical protein